MAQRYVHEYIREIDPKEEKCHLVIELDPKLTLAEAIDHVIESGVQGMPLLTWEGQTMGCLDVRRLVADYLMRMKKRDLVITKALDAIQEGVCICDEQGVVRVWNLAIQKIYEISDEEIVGKNLTEFFPDAIDSQVLKTEEKISYKKHQPKPGADILISAAPIYSEGKLIGVVSTDRRLQDAISLSKRLNEAIRFIEVLEKKIEQDSIHTTDFFVGDERESVGASGYCDSRGENGCADLDYGRNRYRERGVFALCSQEKRAEGQFCSRKLQCDSGEPV